MKNQCARICYGALFAALLAVEVLIALFVHDDFGRPYLGDVLVVAVVYALVRVFLPRGAPLLPLYVTLFAVLVEFSQYFRLVERLGLGKNRFLRIVLGSVFDWRDILCYLAGGALIFAAERLICGRRPL